MHVSTSFLHCKHYFNIIQYLQDIKATKNIEPKNREGKRDIVGKQREGEIVTERNG